jgi:hypothetical protein
MVCVSSKDSAPIIMSPEVYFKPFHPALLPSLPSLTPNVAKGKLPTDIS